MVASVMVGGHLYLVGIAMVGREMVESTGS